MKGPYHLLDTLYLPLDRKNILRTKNIRKIPNGRNRRGGKHSYAEWAHVIGIFQTLIYLHLEQKTNNKILDIGCGTGLLGIASEPFVGTQGRYVGMDVMTKDVEFCRRHYTDKNFEFIHFDVNNPAYAPEQTGSKLKWSVDSDQFDLATALSVWTHLNEEDAVFYFKEINRVLKPDGKAIITFFLLDDSYQNSLQHRSEREGRYHGTSQAQWVFDQSSYGSDAWFHPKWVKVPEKAIGMTEKGLERILAGTDLKLIDHHQGNWKEEPGAFFQDILVFQKSCQES